MQGYTDPDVDTQNHPRPDPSKGNNRAARKTDFSEIVRNQILCAKRTAQACDRCKVNKLKCDTNPDGCTNCTRMNQQCFVTDRITGETAVRGALRQVQACNDRLQAENQRLTLLNRPAGGGEFPTTA
ncbi:hypothetical protein ASPZODRAFT_138396 [Penicilliopsis zonata CBS 506.65]|uniref:Zn(2)-C6 fungal-type domain-containing protein n=1 Tax=Penicilliopsis zonata CBS 506.65 TaxID=1073090 RepID=A0A1L9SVS6_9EURO|nr:hypothetical protein ASPZODRAFT_138396 [Penicilliopsis zonata CBS 506.65]OJJ51289.1 hypothetical protein ASPZODRAFT_138396 [Penicilliopsis zonata CBS 506.65]